MREGRNGIRPDVAALPVQERAIKSAARNKDAKRIFARPLEERTVSLRSKAIDAKQRISDDPKTSEVKREYASKLSELQKAINSVRDELQKITPQLLILEKQQAQLQQRQSQDSGFIKFLRQVVPILDGSSYDLNLLGKQIDNLRPRKAVLDSKLKRYQAAQDEYSSLLTQLSTQQLQAVQREDRATEKIIDINAKRREKSLKVPTI